MRKVQIPTLALLSGSVAAIATIAIPTSCEAFASLGVISQAKISSFLEGTNDVDGSTFDSIAGVESRISAMKVVELRMELKSHDLPTSGIKKILQDRLLDFYRHRMTALVEEDNSKDLSNPAKDDDDDDTEEEDDEQDRERILNLEKQDFDYDDDLFEIRDQDYKFQTTGSSHSKPKWKKKFFLSMAEVRKLVHSNDAAVRQQGPIKARNAVRRLQRSISSSRLTPSSSISLEDGLDASQKSPEDDAIGTVNESTVEFQDYQKTTLLQAYNLWIHAIAKSGSDDAGYLAEEVLREMQENVSNGGPSPNGITIASVMDAHAHSASVSSSNSGAKAAEAFLFEMLEKHEANEEDGTPWSSGNDMFRDSLIVTCDTMLNAWAREGTMESAERVRQVVLRLEEYQRQRQEQRNKVRSKGARRKLTTEKEIARQSTTSSKRPISYSTVMKAWANVGSAKAAEQAESTLEFLIERAKTERKENKSNDDDPSTLVVVQPDTFVFNSVIQCWAASGDKRAGEKSLRLLEKMKELSGSWINENVKNKEEAIYFDTHPDIISYNTVLSAWSHCGMKNAAPQAEKIVKELMIEQQKHQKLDSAHPKKPPVMANTITFNTVLHAWSKSTLSGATDRAEKLLEYMIQSNDREIMPDVYSFTCVMNAWAKSKEPNKALHAQKLLDQLIAMREEALQQRDKAKADALLPTQIPYNTVLNACAFSAFNTSQSEQREAMKTAVATYKAMVSRAFSSLNEKGHGRNVPRDTVTYGLMLKCIANLMPKGAVRSRMALQIFQECCDDGLVGYLVWNEVRRAVPSKLLQETYRFRRQCGLLEVKDLPKGWAVNCKERRRFNKRKQGGGSKKTKKNNERRKTYFIVERSFATGKDM